MLPFFVTGNSRPQNQAIALAVEEAVLVDFQDQPSKQGSAVSGWILLDYGKIFDLLSIQIVVRKLPPFDPSTEHCPCYTLPVTLFFLRNPRSTPRCIDEKNI